MSKIILDKNEHVAVLTINRPEVKNALDGEAYDEFKLAIDEIKQDSAIRVVVITGQDDAFCSGLDLNFSGSMAALNIAEFSATLKKIQAIFQFETVQKPIIAAVNGAALGNGCDIALASDIIFASDNAIFSMAYTNLGLIPDLGGTFRLPRLVGTVKAKEIILTGEKISADEALEIGMINKVFPFDKLMKETMKFAQKIAKRPPLALAMAKMAICNGLNTDLNSSLEYECYLQNICFGSEDVKEAITAFIEKREPKFIGN